MYLLRGTGVPNVYLENGFVREDGEEGPTVAVENLDGLLIALAVEVARRASPLTAGEFRFLRKRLGLSQAGLASKFGKEEQAIAKWEKGVSAAPIAESEALRLFVLAAHSPSAVASRLNGWLEGQTEESRSYVARLAGGQWRIDRVPNRSSVVTVPSDKVVQVGGALAGLDAISADDHLMRVVFLDRQSAATEQGYTLLLSTEWPAEKARTSPKTRYLKERPSVR